MWHYRATCLRVVDGDTVDLRVDLGFGLFQESRFRVRNLDTPETWRPKNEFEKIHGLLATEQAKHYLEHREFEIRTYKGQAGVYGRWECDIIIPEGDYATLLKEGGFTKKDKY